MPKYLFFLVLFPLSLLGEYHATISRVDTSLEARMIKGGSWHRGCPVPLHDLRYLRMRYHDFQGNDRIGEMIVHKEVAEEVTRIFARLYAWGYPIRQMHLVSDFGGNDWQSIEADNTSAFNCRNATGSKRWSKHSYGKAIDLNPIENPYISRSGRISHKVSLPYRKRMHRGEDAAVKAILLKESKAVKLFKSYGWKWGGDWHGVKDYQHFYK